MMDVGLDCLVCFFQRVPDAFVALISSLFVCALNPKP